MKLASLKSIGATLTVFGVVFQTAAQDLIIEARTADPQYAEANGNWQNSSVHATAPGTTPSIGSRWNTTAGSSIILTPTLAAGGSYFLDAAFPVPVAASQSADIVVRIDLVGATLTELGTNTTVNAGAIESGVFQRAGGGTGWRRIGKLVLDEGTATPTITFTHISGVLSATPSVRFYSDAFRFLNASDPCLNGLPVLSTLNGPLAAGQTFVNVPGVATNASKVTVYADGVQIGQKSSGILGGTNVEVVVTTALVSGQVISLTQHDAAGVESCRPNTGPVVGSGANPPVRVSYSLRMDPALTGPIGAEGTSASAWLWMLGASGPAAGFGTAPLGGAVLQPGPCWQTVTFQYGTDDGYTWAGTAGEVPTFAILDAVAFSMEDPYNSGPYAIYVDNVMNGSTVIEDFETAQAGTVEYLFTEPDFSGTTVGNLLSQAPGAITPNVSVVTNANADTGTNSTLLSWQFKDATAASWVRIPLIGTGKKTPQVDLSQPISMRFLVLPVGETSGALQVGNIGNVNVTPGGNVTLQAPIIKGTGALTYQWKKNGQDISGATGPTYAINNATAEAAANYSVTVSDGTCTTESFGILTVSDVPVEPELTFARAGNNLQLTWTDPQAILQTATALTGSATDWSDVTTTGTTHEVPMTDAMRFFRLRR
jgi:hypothetical protein